MLLFNNSKELEKSLEMVQEQISDSEKMLFNSEIEIPYKPQINLNSENELMKGLALLLENVLVRIDTEKE
ncbi:MAG: hypothetical protein N3E40_04605, partial [Dehalococcoidia bacterium]|nr:hypothetical protein [Dehalococcoidia bacterium]